jgi:hypothetical protein
MPEHAGSSAETRIAGGSLLSGEELCDEAIDLVGRLDLREVAGAGNDGDLRARDRVADEVEVRRPLPGLEGSIGKFLSVHADAAVAVTSQPITGWPVSMRSRSCSKTAPTNPAAASASRR